MIGLLAATGAVALAAAVFAALLRPRGTLDYLLAVGLTWQAMIVTSVGVAGLLLGSLAPVTLLSLAGAWLAVAGIAAWRLPERRSRWPGRLRAAAHRIRSAVLDPAAVVAGVLVVGTLGWRAFLATRLPIVDYDGWSYHLVFVDVWLQHDALVQVTHRPWTSGYPAVTELLTTWLMAFTRTDTFAGFTSLLPTPTAIVATAGLARAFGARPSTALLAGLLFGMTPALVALAGSSYVDASSVAMVAATWWLGLRVVRGERDLATLVLLGVAGGLAVGTKGTNILLAGPVLAASGLLLLRGLLPGQRGSGDRASARMTITRVAVLSLPVIVLGLTWYLKNLVVYGNPLYPFAIGPFAGPTTLVEFTFTPPQLEGRSWLGQVVGSWLADWGLNRYAYNVRPGGLGRAWPFIAAIAAVGAVLLLRRRSFAIFALLVAPAAVTLLSMPGPWYARYTLFLPALALPLVAVALDRGGRRLAMLGGLALVGLAAISLVVANIRPNIDIRAATGSTSQPGPVAYLRYVLADDERRANVSLRADCAEYATDIPAGARVAPGGFNLLHGVVGPDLGHILVDPLPPVADVAALIAALRAVGAEWIATSTGGRLDLMIAAEPAAFVDHGDVCQGGRLWELREHP